MTKTSSDTKLQAVVSIIHLRIESDSQNLTGFYNFQVQPEPRQAAKGEIVI